MRRHLIPRFAASRWGGDGLTVIPPADRRHPECAHDEIKGGILTIQWLGIIVEIAIGKVR
jgi:hypothetical protein